MDKQLDTTIELIQDQAGLRDLINFEILLIGGGEALVNNV